MGLFSKFKKGHDKTPAVPAAPDYNPKGKSFEWFFSEEGMESFKLYVTAQNYMLEEGYKEEYERRFSEYDFDTYLRAIHGDAKCPCIYFTALADAIKVQPLQIVGASEFFVESMETMAKPYSINDDGEPEACEPMLSSDQLMSVEQNPLLNFVLNFNVFELIDDALGSRKDKLVVYIETMSFVATNAKHIVMEENQWLFDKNTYVNEFGTIRKQKGFLKKCKEISKFPEYFDLVLSQTD